MIFCFLILFIVVITSNKFFFKCKELFFLYKTYFLYQLVILFLFFIINYSYCMLFEILTKPFHTIFASITMKLVFCWVQLHWIKLTICKRWVPRRYMHSFSFCWWLFRIILTKDYFNSAKITIGAFNDFSRWLYLNVLFSLLGIST